MLGWRGEDAQESDMAPCEVNSVGIADQRSGLNMIIGVAILLWSDGESIQAH